MDPSFIIIPTRIGTCSGARDIEKGSQTPMYPAVRRSRSRHARRRSARGPWRLTGSPPYGDDDVAAIAHPGRPDVPVSGCDPVVQLTANRPPTLGLKATASFLSPGVAAQGVIKSAQAGQQAPHYLFLPHGGGRGHAASQRALAECSRRTAGSSRSGSGVSVCSACQARFRAPRRRRGQSTNRRSCIFAINCTLSQPAR